VKLENGHTFPVVVPLKQNDKICRELVSPEIVDFFGSFDADHKWTVEGEGEWLIAYRANDLVEPERYSEFFAQAARIADLFQQSARRASAPRIDARRENLP
jgi:hypothetical protein